jgi:prevent-host-death family protein
MGVRELKAALSKTLRDVSRGEHIRVTSRGRVLAEIVPAGAARADDRLAKLVAEGRVTPPQRPRRPLPPLARARQSAVELVLAERDDER